MEPENAHLPASRQSGPDRTPVFHEPDRVDFDPEYDPAAPVVCELCGFVMGYTGACKLMCGNCGYKRDCSDP